MTTLIWITAGVALALGAAVALVVWFLGAAASAGRDSLRRK